MEFVSKRARWRSALGIALAIPLLVGGCAASPEKVDEPAQAEQTAPEGFAGVGADGESVNLFPDNGVKNDGYGSYLQSTIADDDPALKFSRNLVDPEVWDAGLTEEQVTQAQAVAMRFLATEGIDSTLRAPRNGESQKAWDEWVAANKDQFADDVEFSMDNSITYMATMTPERLALNGWPNGDPSGTSDWKQESPFEYQYGEDKMRMVNRNIIPGEIFLSGYEPGQADMGLLTFRGQVSYSLRATHNGSDSIESDEAEYRIEMKLASDGEWKVSHIRVTSLIGE